MVGSSTSRPRHRHRTPNAPLTPRGWYVFDGYAAQRQLDNSPGISTPTPQNLDAAAIYFIEDAGRGGYGGYLSSDADDNEYLLSANNKFLTGYPLDGIAETNKGKLHAATPANLGFTHLYTAVFVTTDLQSFPGNSGGPLSVQVDVNNYLPAAIYLGGSGQTLVRAINSEVVDLINRAEISGNGGGNSTGGGVTILSPGQTTSVFGTGLLTVNLSPTNTMTVGAGWRVANSGSTNYITDATATVALIGGGSYSIEFKPVFGFAAPTNRTVTVAVGGQVTLQANYVSAQPAINFTRGNGLNLQGVVGSTYRVEFTTNYATPTNIWTTLTNITLTNASQVIGGTQPPKTGRRFYRAVLVP